MIKHGKVHQYFGTARAKSHSHLDPIKDFITKGIADAKEGVVLHPCSADVKGAKRFDGQQCVIARALTREHKPDAVAIGRSYAYAVFNGLAVRFMVPRASRRLIEEFDSQGRVRKAPIELSPVAVWRRLTKRRDWKAEYEKTRKSRSTYTKGRRAKRYGVRAIGGGVTA